MIRIEIPKRKNQCHKKEEVFESGHEYYSILLENPKEGIIRLDYCPSCWNEQKGNIPKNQGYWKGIIPSKAQIAETKSSKIDKALKLLCDAEADEKELFILALYLAHARRLVLRREFEENSYHYNQYEILHKEEFVTIKMLKLKDEEIQGIRQSLASKL